MKHIVIEHEVKERLDQLKLYRRDTYNEVIKRLLDNVQQK